MPLVSVLTVASIAREGNGLANTYRHQLLLLSRRPYSLRLPSRCGVTEAELLKLVVTYTASKRTPALTGR